MEALTYYNANKETFFFGGGPIPDSAQRSFLALCSQGTCAGPGIKLGSYLQSQHLHPSTPSSKANSHINPTCKGSLLACWRGVLRPWILKLPECNARVKSQEDPTLVLEDVVVFILQDEVQALLEASINETYK